MSQSVCLIVCYQAPVVNITENNCAMAQPTSEEGQHAWYISQPSVVGNLPVGFNNTVPLSVIQQVCDQFVK